MDNSLIHRLVKYDDAYLPLLALIICFILRKKIPRAELLLIIYLVINFVFSTVTNIMGDYRINNLVLYHFYTLFEQWYLSYYLIKKITQGKIPGLYYYVNGGFTLFWIINILSLEPYTVYNSNTSVISSLIILLLCMYYMLELSKREEILYFQRVPSFWINSAFLFYNALGVLIFAVYKYYTAYYTVDKIALVDIDYWVMMHLPIVLKYVLISIGIICYSKIPPIKQPKIILI